MVKTMNLVARVAPKRKNNNKRKGGSKASAMYPISRRNPRPSTTRNGAPVSSGLRNRRPKQGGVFAPVALYTSDLLDTVQMGTNSMNVVYNNLLGPQELPPEARGTKMAAMYAKYRVRKATIRIESAIPTSSGGQYGAFFDPNPNNDWQVGNAIGALTSMPVQDTAAAWECLTLKIPPAELERETELFTSSSQSEQLVTRFGQLVILCLAPPSATPPGTASVTVWLDAQWEFYEPNAKPGATGPSIVFPGGPWTVDADGHLTTIPAPSPAMSDGTAYRMYPALPTTLFASGEEETAIAIGKRSGSGALCFATEAAALAYVNLDDASERLGGAATAITLVQTVGVPITGVSVARSLPFKPVSVPMK